MKSSIFLPILLALTACQQAPVSPDAAEEAALSAIVPKIFDLWNSGDMALWEQVYTADYTRNHNGSKSRGFDEWKRNYEATKLVYPDLKTTYVDAWADGNKATITWRATGTNKGAFGEGMPATGKPVTIEGVSLVTLKDGKIADEWAVSDGAAVFVQVGYTFQPPAGASSTSTTHTIKK